MSDSHHTIEIDGRAVPLRVRRNARARQLILRVDEDTGGAVVTIPKRTAIRDGVDMARRKAAWIAAQLKRLPIQVPFVPGASIPYLGSEHILCHQPDARGARLAGGEDGAPAQIIISGRAEYFARRTTDWLKSQAKAEITARAHAKAALLPPYEGSGAGQRLGRITVRDTRSRWGSCTADGHLNFSWRLILAPAFVLDYVVAHEVAHLRHRNHGPKFWALAESLTPRMNEAKAWVNAHGRDLHRYG